MRRFVEQKSPICPNSTRRAKTGLHNANREAQNRDAAAVCGVGHRRRGRGRTAAVRVDLSRVTRTLHHVAPYLTVPYSTVPYRVLRCRKNPRLRRSDPVSLQESQGERKPLWETGRNVGNSVESLWKTCRSGEWGRRWAGWPGSGVVRDGWLGSGVVRDGWPGSDVVRGCGCWVRCGDRAEQDAGAAQGALAGFLSERKSA